MSYRLFFACLGESGWLATTQPEVSESVSKQLFVLCRNRIAAAYEHSARYR